MRTETQQLKVLIFSVKKFKRIWIMEEMEAMELNHFASIIIEIYLKMERMEQMELKKKISRTSALTSILSNTSKPRKINLDSIPSKSSMQMYQIFRSFGRNGKQSLVSEPACKIRNGIVLNFQTNPCSFL
eukprot:UN23149